MNLIRLTKLKYLNGELDNLNSYEREFFYVILRLKMKSVSNDEDLYYNDLNMPIFLYSKNRQILFFSTRIDSIFDTEPIKQNGNTSLIVNRIIHLHLGINYIKSKYITEQTWRILII